MLKRGAFAEIGPLEADGGDLSQARRRRRRRGAADQVQGRRVREVVERHFAGLQALLDRFRDPDDRLSLAPVPEIRRPRRRLRPSRPRRRMGARRRATRRERRACNDAARPAAQGVRPARLGLGLRQRRLRQDACAGAAGDAAAARRRRAVEDPLPHLHQGGGRQHGERVFDRLSRWTQLDDAALAAELAALDAPPPSAGRPGAGAQTVRARASRRRAASRSRPSTPSASACCTCFRSRPTCRRGFRAARRARGGDAARAGAGAAVRRRATRRRLSAAIAARRATRSAPTASRR